MNSEYFVEPGSTFVKILRKLPYLNSLVKKWAPPDFIYTPHNVSYFDSPVFKRSYKAAVDAVGFDYRIPWRVHQAIWSAHNGLKIEGDFVELGTGKGFVMKAVLHSFDDWNSLDKSIWLYDLFESYYVSGKGEEKHNKYYAQSVDEVKSIFYDFKRVHFVQGDVLDTVNKTFPEKISFLHVDLNDADSEQVCIELLWPRVSKGAIVLLDDYANRGQEKQYNRMNKIFNRLGCPVLTTPSGQGVVVK